MTKEMHEIKPGEKISQCNDIVQGRRIRLFYVRPGIQRHIKHDICSNQIKETSMFVFIQSSEK